MVEIGYIDLISTSSTTHVDIIGRIPNMVVGSTGTVAHS
jgi:hypothetical protein